VPFSDLHLAQRLELAEGDGGARFVEARHRLAPEVQAQWIEVAGTRAMFDGADSPLTQTFGLGLFAEATEGVLQQLEMFFRARGAPVNHEVSPLSGVALADRLCRRGYRPIEFTSVMYRPLPVPYESFDGSLRVRPMATGEEDLWSEVSRRGWGEYPNLRDFLLGLGRVTAQATGAVALFAELDGKPVATAVLRCFEGIAVLAGASTVPEARKRGAQRALLGARLTLAANEGCDLAMMCAEPGSASQRNAERHGFRIAYTRTKWQLATRS
jgi:GNAT superfamily N-acetyltransferase